MENFKCLLDKLEFNDRELIPAIVQDKETREVLMMAYMNEEALIKTINTGKAHFWSRSRQELWLKGETSGNFQRVDEIRVDCDQDTLLLLVNPQGPACHTEEKSCFYRQINGDKVQEGEEDFLAVKRDEFIEKIVFLKQLSGLIEKRKAERPQDSYTTYLFNKGIDKIAKKLGEEAAEIIIAGKNEVKDEIIHESADFIYHLLVLLILNEIDIKDVMEELRERHGENN